MGDVKRSGKTFEERKAASIAKKELEIKRREEKRRWIEANKTPLQKLKERQSRIELMVLQGLMGLGLTSIPQGVFPVRGKNN